MTTEAPTTDYCMSCDTSAREAGTLRYERDCLQAKNERLRWALVEIAEMPLDEDNESRGRYQLPNMKAIARRALAEAK